MGLESGELVARFERDELDGIMMLWGKEGRARPEPELHIS
jgi:hypothetical protein